MKTKMQEHLLITTFLLIFGWAWSEDLCVRTADYKEKAEFVNSIEQLFIYDKRN